MHVRRVVWLLSLLIFLALASSILRPVWAQRGASAASDDGIPQVVRIYVNSQAEANVVSALGVDLLEARGTDYLFALMTEAERQRLQERGYVVEVDAAASSSVRRFSQGLTFRDGYRTVEEVTAFMQQAASGHPSLAELVDYGDSWLKTTTGGAQGYDLWALRLTNQAISGQKPTFLLIAAIHARELSTTELAYRFTDHLLQNYGTDPNVTWLLDWHEVWIVPIANPDGRKRAEAGLLHRKNINDSNGGECRTSDSEEYSFDHYGTDLNRNASFAWGTSGSSGIPCEQTYRGPSAASEPEEQALEALMRQLFPQQRDADLNAAAPEDTTGIMITLHSYGKLVLWPWGFSDVVRPPNYDGLKALGDKFAAYNGYTSCQAGPCLYTASGTTDDWAYGTLGIPAFTFEVGPPPGNLCGNFMPSYTCVDSFWQDNLPAFLYAAKVARAPYLQVQGPDALGVTATLDKSGVLVMAAINDTANGGQSISAAEVTIDTPPWAGGTPYTLQAADGLFDETVEDVQAHLPVEGLSVGRHILFVRGQDTDGDWGPVSAAFFNVGIPALTATPTATPTKVTTPTVTPTLTPTPALTIEVSTRLYLPLWHRTEFSRAGSD